MFESQDYSHFVWPNEWMNANGEKTKWIDECVCAWSFTPTFSPYHDCFVVAVKNLCICHQPTRHKRRNLDNKETEYDLLGTRVCVCVRERERGRPHPNTFYFVSLHDHKINYPVLTCSTSAATGIYGRNQCRRIRHIFCILWSG